MARRTTKRKKKAIKLERARVHIHSTFNNTILTLTDLNGDVITWKSPGTVGFSGSRKGTPYAAQLAAQALAKEMKHGGEAVLDNSMIRQRLAQAYIELMVLKYNGFRSLSEVIKGGVPGPQGSIGKIIWSELHQRMSELALDIEGPYHQLMKNSPLTLDNGFWQYTFLRAKGNTIEAGSAEILRNIVGERVLGLPKDMARAVLKERS